MKLQILRLVLVALNTAILVGCTHSDDAITRKEQAQAFQNAFGFFPPDELTEISYHSIGAWAPNLGGHISLMRFTYVPSVVEKIEKKYNLALTVFSPASVEKPPSWWWQPLPGEQVYQNTTNGVVRLMWIKQEQSFVFYQEFNVD